MEYTHDCHCGCEHDHGMEERSEEFAKVNADKYHEAFGKFESVGTNEEVKAQVTALLDKHAKENFTPEVLKRIRKRVFGRWLNQLMIMKVLVRMYLM